MKKSHLLIMLITVSMVFFSSCSNEAVTSGDEGLDLSSKAMAKMASKSTVPVVFPPSMDVWGTSTLHRNDKGITVNYKVEGLTEGHAYTLWWVVWNKPENCAGYPEMCADSDFANAEEIMPEIMYATGHVVGASGVGNFTGHLNLNDASGSINVEYFGLPTFGGLLDAQGAEIHTVLHSHGPAIPGLVNEQINSYWGGCQIDLGIFTGAIPTEPGECSTFLAAVHQPE